MFIGSISSSAWKAGAFACLAAALLAPNAASATALFDGTAYIAGANSACQGAITGFNPGLQLTLHFRSQTAAGDPPDAILMESSAGDGLITGTGSSGSLKGAATFSAILLSGVRFDTFSNSNAGSSNLKFSPAAITPTTKNATFTGTIKNLFGIPSCILTVQGALTQRP